MDFIIDNNNAEKIWELVKKPESSQLSPEDALALIVEASLTSSAYISMRAAALKANCDLYPTYKQVFYYIVLAKSMRVTHDLCSFFTKNIKNNLFLMNQKSLCFDFNASLIINIIV